jgi:hypothetical protein
MRKVLVFDADRSLASLGNEEQQVEILGTKPIRCPNLILLKKYMEALTKIEAVEDPHEMFGDIEGVDQPKEYKLVFNNTAISNGLWGVAIDTWSHMASAQMDMIVKQRIKREKAAGKLKEGETKTDLANKSQFSKREFEDYDLLGQHGWHLMGMIKLADFPVIMNCHVKETDGPTGKIAIPDMQGSVKERIAQVFDIVVFSDKKSVDGREYYHWITRATGRLSAAKIRHPFVRERVGQDIAQNYDELIRICEKGGLHNPKILNLANSGYGKTSSLATINGFMPPNFNKVNNEVHANGVE